MSLLMLAHKTITEIGTIFGQIHTGLILRNGKHLKGKMDPNLQSELIQHRVAGGYALSPYVSFTKSNKKL